MHPKCRLRKRRHHLPSFVILTQVAADVEVSIFALVPRTELSCTDNSSFLFLCGDVPKRDATSSFLLCFIFRYRQPTSDLPSLFSSFCRKSFMKHTLYNEKPMQCYTQTNLSNWIPKHIFRFNGEDWIKTTTCFMKLCWASFCLRSSFSSHCSLFCLSLQGELSVAPSPSPPRLNRKMGRGEEGSPSNSARKKISPFSLFSGPIAHKTLRGRYDQIVDFVLLSVCLSVPEKLENCWRLRRLRRCLPI